MLSGRHFILLGFIACAGLLSVHDGQKQIEMCYKIAAVEKDLRDVRSDIDLCKIKHQALQSPKSVATKADQLKLGVAPNTPAPVVALPAQVRPPLPDTQRSLGSAQGRVAATNGPVPAPPARPAGTPAPPAAPQHRNP